MAKPRKYFSPKHVVGGLANIVVVASVLAVGCVVAYAATQAPAVQTTALQAVGTLNQGPATNLVATQEVHLPVTSARMKEANSDIAAILANLTLKDGDPAKPSPGDIQDDLMNLYGTYFPGDADEHITSAEDANIRRELQDLYIMAGMRDGESDKAHQDLVLSLKQLNTPVVVSATTATEDPDPKIDGAGVKVAAAIQDGYGQLASLVNNSFGPLIEAWAPGKKKAKAAAFVPPPLPRARPVELAVPTMKPIAFKVVDTTVVADASQPPKNWLETVPWLKGLTPVTPKVTAVQPVKPTVVAKPKVTPKVTPLAKPVLKVAARKPLPPKVVAGPAQHTVCYSNSQCENIPLNISP